MKMSDRISMRLHTMETALARGKALAKNVM